MDAENALSFVTPDGDVPDAGRGESVKTLRQLSPAACLAASSPPPSRMLVWHRQLGPQGKTKGAVAAAMFYAFMAMLPAVWMMWLAGSLTHSRELSAFCFFAIMLGAPLIGFIRHMIEPDESSHYDSAEWLDFDERTWRSRTLYLDGVGDNKFQRIPLHELALVCHVESGDTDYSYEVSLFRIADVQAPPRQESWGPWWRLGRRVTDIKSFGQNDKAQALDFARALAACWQMGCWDHAEGPLSPPIRVF